MTDRELMQQALEALKFYYEQHGEESDKKVITALRERLAQPEHDDPIGDAQDKLIAEQAQEPVAWMHNLIEGNVIAHRPADIDRHPERWTALYTAPPPCPTCEALARSVMMDQTSHDIAPRQWQGLTADEIWQCNAAPPESAVEYHVCMAHQNVLDFAEAIEAKLKEKNT